MPYVNVKVTGGVEAPSRDQKAALIKGITDLLFDVLKKDPSTTFVVIDEVDMDNWGVSGETVTNLRSKTAR